MKVPAGAPRIADAFGFDDEDEFASTPAFLAPAPAAAPAEPRPPGDDALLLQAAPGTPAAPAPVLAPPLPMEQGESSAPRINIHVFCRKAATAEVAGAAAADRRLQRATTSIRNGGLPEALESYGNHPTPPLVIVESGEPASELLAGLDRLAEVCDPGTKVMVIGDQNDIALYRALMGRGVSEYIVEPLHPVQLIRAITSLYADPATPFVGRTLAFLGAKGGVGSSTLAHNVAHTLAETVQANTVIVDLDLPFGAAGLNFNQDPIQGVADALSTPDRLDPVLLDRMTARCTERLGLFAAPASLDDDYEIAADTYEEVLGKIRGSAPFVVLDLPHLWSGWLRKTILAADDVVIVATPDLASLRNAKNLIDLVKKARPNDAPPHLVLNQVGQPGRPEIPLKEFAKAMDQEPVLVLPYDAKLFGQAANNGQMLTEVNAKAKAAEGLALFAQRLARRDNAPVAAAAKPAGVADLIGRLTRRGG